MKITIEGNAGEGKSTIATLISNALKGAGVTNVTVKDEEILPVYYEPDRQKSRLAHIAMKGTHFYIETVQTRQPWYVRLGQPEGL